MKAHLPKLYYFSWNSSVEAGTSSEMGSLHGWDIGGGCRLGAHPELSAWGLSFSGYGPSMSSGVPHTRLTLSRLSVPRESQAEVIVHFCGLTLGIIQTSCFDTLFVESLLQGFKRRGHRLCFLLGRSKVLEEHLDGNIFMIISGKYNLPYLGLCFYMTTVSGN